MVVFNQFKYVVQNESRQMILYILLFRWHGGQITHNVNVSYVVPMKINLHLNHFFSQYTRKTRECSNQTKKL